MATKAQPPVCFVASASLAALQVQHLHKAIRFPAMEAVARGYSADLVEAPSLSDPSVHTNGPSGGRISTGESTDNSLPIIEPHLTPSPSDSLLQEDDNTLPSERFKSFVKADSLLAGRELSNRAKAFYKDQNAMIESFVKIDRNEIVDEEEEAKRAKSARFAITMSFCVNVVLFCIKLYAAIASMSLSVIASTVDSILDLCSGSVVFLTSRIKNRANLEKYPVGKHRIEPLGVVVFASIMGTASLQIVREAASKLASADHSPPAFAIGPVVVLACTIVSKLCLFVLCRVLGRTNTAARALAQDHINDVLTNSLGAVAYLVATMPALWWLDSAGAIGLSCFIIVNWGRTVAGLVKSLMGHTADWDFIQQITYIAATHSHFIQAVDTVQAYQTGSGAIVEIHIVLDRRLPLKTSHDVSEALSLRVERVPHVERCYVHVDYEAFHKPSAEHASIAS
eukprot:GAFH01001736.1.p1 GENE.GAFH01001736.1~~GAFH01001736.1.p1  ORF type:complete len:453 (-),score=115.21 GAFH01001736.1:58-1416(-)